MHPKLAVILNGAKSIVLLKYQVPGYEERAEEYKHNAYMYALRRAQIDENPYPDDIGTVIDSVILRFYQGRRVEIIKNEEGAHFIRTPNGNYHYIDMQISEAQLRKGRHYEALSKSAVRRYLIQINPLSKVTSAVEDLGNTVRWELDSLNYILYRLNDTLAIASEGTKGSLSSPQDPLELILGLDTPKSLPAPSTDKTD